MAQARYALVRLLHPAMRPHIERLERELFSFRFELPRGCTGHFEIFETYRTPMRQDDLLRPVGNQVAVTKAPAYSSAHQFGLACDYAIMVDSEDPADMGWSWHAGPHWDHLKKVVEEGYPALSMPIKWDKGHIQHRIWPEVLFKLHEAARLGLS